MSVFVRFIIQLKLLINCLVTLILEIHCNAKQSIILLSYHISYNL